jgi:DNA modification methylase
VSIYYTDEGVTLHHGNALALPLADNTVDLVVTSPPYFGLRSYRDDGEHYVGQIGAEATPAEFVDALLTATVEMVRVLKSSGSIWVNLGDKYAQNTERSRNGNGNRASIDGFQGGKPLRGPTGTRTKSLFGIPWRYALRCIDDLGLILRAEVIWSKPNGLPESVTDRVRRSHEQWFHFTKEPRYYSAVDAIRETYAPGTKARYAAGYVANTRAKTGNHDNGFHRSVSDGDTGPAAVNALGKLPGSVWSIATQPLKVPAELGIDHFAAFPMEWPRRIIQGWSPPGVCTACGEGRRPVGERDPNCAASHRQASCACPDTTAPTTPATVLDPFGGTGTTALVARVLGRHGVSVDLSEDYCRLAKWRTTDPGQIARAMRVAKPAKQVRGQPTLFDMDRGRSAEEPHA